MNKLHGRVDYNYPMNFLQNEEEEGEEEENEEEEEEEEEENEEEKEKEKGTNVRDLNHLWKEFVTLLSDLH